MTFNVRFRIGTKDAMMLLRNLAISLKAGVSITKALALFEEDARGSRKKVIRHLRTSTESGHMLSEAMENAPLRFHPLSINLVRTGELGGTLQESLEQIVAHLKQSVALRRKIRSAMMYPTFVFVAIVGLGLSIGIFVLPELIPLFESLDVELPLATRLLLWSAEYFAVHGVLTGIVVVAVVLGLWCITRFEFAKPTLHWLLLHIPYLGDVQHKTAVAQMASTMSTLLSSGIPIQDAIPATAQSVENRIYRRALFRALSIVEKGRTFAKALDRVGVFPRMATALVSIGEETGTLTESLNYLSEYYEDEVDYAVKNMTTALEPILLIFIGIIVGGTVLAIITPIYDVTGSIR